MNKKVLIGVIAIASIILLGTWAYMATRGPAPDQTTDIRLTPQSDIGTPSEAPVSDTAVEPTSTATITYTNEGFSPNTITVTKDSTVTVTNTSDANVMLSSADHPTHKEQPELNMEMLKPGESGTITLTQVGTWGYHDHINASMTGTIIVTE